MNSWLHLKAILRHVSQHLWRSEEGLIVFSGLSILVRFIYAIGFLLCFLSSNISKGLALLSFLFPPNLNCGAWRPRGSSDVWLTTCKFTPCFQGCISPSTILVFTSFNNYYKAHLALWADFLVDCDLLVTGFNWIWGSLLSRRDRRGFDLSLLSFREEATIFCAVDLRPSPT